MQDYRITKSYTDDFMSLWRSYKPTICKVQGHAVAGVPKNQLMMQKLMINQAYDNMGLANTQMTPPCSTASPVTRRKACGSSSTRSSTASHVAVQWRDSGKPIPEGGEAK